jgi:pheromone shutdown-related protein TraB
MQNITEKQKKDSMVNFLTCNGKNIILIGTAHVSRQSAELVQEVIFEHKPDTVCVELCETRLSSLKDQDRWRNMDIIKIIKEKKAMLLFINMLLALFQKKIADKFGIKPGQEMINAVEAAEKINAEIVPADREIRVTLTRAWRGMGLWEKLKFLFSLVFSFIGTDDIKEEDIEKMKEVDILQTILTDVKKSHPIIGKVLINERDQFLAEKIRTAPGDNIAAVVGAAHVPGITKYLSSNDKIDIFELNRIPPVSKSGQIIKWGIPAAIIMLIIAGFFMEGKAVGTKMIWIWIATNGIMAGIGALLAMAHPLTILSAIIAAPMTSLNPMIAAGWVSGIVEVYARKPRVKDFEAIPEDICSFRGFWRNSVTRILLVVVFTNLGSAIGTFMAMPLMLKLFA